MDTTKVKANTIIAKMTNSYETLYPAFSSDDNIRSNNRVPRKIYSETTPSFMQVCLVLFTIFFISLLKLFKQFHLQQILLLSTCFLKSSYNNNNVFFWTTLSNLCRLPNCAGRKVIVEITLLHVKMWNFFKSHPLYLFWPFLKSFFQAYIPVEIKTESTVITNRHKNLFLVCLPTRKEAKRVKARWVFSLIKVKLMWDNTLYTSIYWGTLYK